MTCLQDGELRSQPVEKDCCEILIGWQKNSGLKKNLYSQQGFNQDLTFTLIQLKVFVAIFDSGSHIYPGLASRSC